MKNEEQGCQPCQEEHISLESQFFTYTVPQQNNTDMIKIRLSPKIVAHKVLFGYNLNLEKPYLSIDANANAHLAFNQRNYNSS